MDLNKLTKAQLIEKIKTDQETNAGKLKTLYEGVRQKDEKILRLETDLTTAKNNEVAKLVKVEESVNKELQAKDLRFAQLAKEYSHVNAGLVGNVKIVMGLNDLNTKQKEVLDDILKLYQSIYIEEVKNNG
jgi:hypothetical protein